jgi:hypothetical protein
MTMLTLAELLKKPGRLSELGEDDVLVAAVDETVVQKVQSQIPQATMVFEHETMKMMMAERAEKVEKLKELLEPHSVIIPLRKKDGGIWDHITVGRASTADIVLDDPAISNVHAHFLFDDDNERMSLQDVGSSNGTFVNREPLQPHQQKALRTGDVVRFGQTIFYYLGMSTLKRLVEG